MKSSLLRLILVMVFTIACSNFSYADSSADCAALPQLTVRGEAVLHVPADQMQLSMGVVTSAVTVEAAMDSNTKKMHDVEKALIGAGLNKDEYRTGRFQVQPQWEPRPRQPVPDWQPRIVGY